MGDVTVRLKALALLCITESCLGPENIYDTCEIILTHVLACLVDMCTGIPPALLAPALSAFQQLVEGRSLPTTDHAGKTAHMS